MGSQDKIIVNQTWECKYGPKSGHAGVITCLESLPATTIFSSGGSDGTVQFWDWKAWSPIYQGVSARGELIGLTASQDGARIYGQSTDGQVYCWDIVTGHLLHLFPSSRANYGHVGIHDDGKRVQIAPVGRCWERCPF